MVYLGIALVIALLVAPIIALRPSGRQREQMALRQAARARGLRTELVTIEDPDPDPDSYRSVTGKALAREIKCIAYRRSRRRPSDTRRLPALAWAVGRNTGATDGPLSGWRWETPLPEFASDELRAAIPHALESMPDDVIRVDEEYADVSAYWRERGGMEAFEQIADALDALAAATPLQPGTGEEREDDSSEP